MKRPPIDPSRSRRSNKPRRLLLRARAALPIASPPLSDAGVLIEGNRLRLAGRWRDVAREIGADRIDLGDVVLLPGLINAHCHLDYTRMAGLLTPLKSFTDWIKQITVAKSTWSDGEFADSWKAGAEMLVQTGTTCVADVEALPHLLPELWKSTPLRVFSFLEMTGVRSRRNPRAILDAALEQIRRLPRGRCRAALSPHAPYSTQPSLLSLTARACGRRRWPFTTHVAESAQEFEMFMHGRGDMHEWLARNERDMSDCGRVSPVQHMDRCGALGTRLLAVHVNYLAPGDAQLLGSRGVHVVHCPCSHAYFQHREFPHAELRKAGVNVCLGTDSLASTPSSRERPASLDMFGEMRQFQAKHPDVGPRAVLEMATVNAAKALGQQGQLGQLTPGARADFIAVPCAGSVRRLYQTVLDHQGPVVGSMINGRWAWRLERE